MRDTSTNAEGAFRFDSFGPFATDTVNMVLKALNKHNKDYGIRVELEEVPFPDPSVINRIGNFTPGLLLADTVSRQLVESRVRVLGRIDPGSIMLEEAVVTAQAQIPGSRNLNKGGGADQVILQEVFEDTPKKTLFDLLYEHVDGFGIQYVNGLGEFIPSMPGLPGIISRAQVYTVGSNYARFVIDGMELSRFYYPSGMYADDQSTPWLPTDETLIEDFDPRGYMDYLRPYLELFKAEDIVGMEVMSSMRYKSRYQNRHLGMKENISAQGIGTRGLAFIEITTRLGTGPFLNKIPGEYRFRPLVPVVSPEFYSPRYTSSERGESAADTRVTLYWNPDVLMDKNGEARFSFYTSDSAGGYVIRSYLGLVRVERAPNEFARSSNQAPKPTPSGLQHDVLPHALSPLTARGWFEYSRALVRQLFTICFGIFPKRCRRSVEGLSKASRTLVEGLSNKSRTAVEQRSKKYRRIICVCAHAKVPARSGLGLVLAYQLNLSPI